MNRKDINQTAFAVLQIATGETKRAALTAQEIESKAKKSEAGKSGGRARSAQLSQEQRTAIARNAAKKRWS